VQVQFIADSWRRVSTKTIQICFAHCGFKHSDLQMPNKADSENDVILEMHHVGNYEGFSRIFNVIIKMKTVRIVAKHQKIRKPMRITRPSVNE
jgi:hypothetical protein